MRIAFQSCQAGECLPLMIGFREVCGLRCHCLEGGALSLPVGTQLCADDALCKVTGHMWLAAPDAVHASHCPLLTALVDVPAGTLDVTVSKRGWSLAWVTLSDKGSQGLRRDASGPLIRQMVQEALPLCHSQGFMLSDAPDQLRWLLTSLALEQGYDLVCTTGGTGVAPRDFAPQVTAFLLDMQLPGFSQAMMAASLAKTPNASISRAVAGVLGSTLVVNLPGSRKAVQENLEAILPAIGHALAKLNGDTADCGG